MHRIVIIPLIWISLFGEVESSFEKMGCFKKSSVQSLLTFNDNDTYQSSGYCQEQCSDDAVFGLIDGKSCYCGNTIPDSSDEVDDSNCNTVCQGYGYEKCGGLNYFLIYTDSSAQASTAGGDSSTLSSSSPTSSTETSTSTSSDQTSEVSTTSQTSTSSSSSSSTSPSTSSEATSEQSGYHTTIVSVESESQSVREVTKTVEWSTTLSHSSTGKSTSSTSTANASKTTHASTTSSNEHNETKDNKDSGKSLSGGGIAGVVVGSIAGAAILAAGLIFFICHRRRSDDDKDDEFTLSGPEQEKSETFGGAAGSHVQHNHQASNGQMLGSFASTQNDDLFIYGPSAHPNDMTGDHSMPIADFGRRRLSNGSLPDMVQRNHGSLKVVNN
ncbi:uncharacterized protein PRCAT00000185001 [Priceomyces carsonii]|uniref:uncharacterized protein n=1 Tax=Priceomyces carsonii TaxID=28549 RepID=UPI002EDAF05A|nr:unnamed protein product [Priceomyces carsonii]